MKKIFLYSFAAVLFSACTPSEVKVAVDNTSDLPRTNEIVTLNAEEVAAFDSFVILNAAGEEVPYQITYDNLLIFPASVAANTTEIYTVKAGTPAQPFATQATGKIYPERVDDIAWENDRIAFRAYGPALQASGERAFGMDVWVKSVPEMVVDYRYNTELNSESRAKIAELSKTDPAAAKELAESISYHIDHGNGLDYYKVGPTLGAGTSALMDAQGNILYPYCYKEIEILDNGPLRFTVKLVYHPTQIGNEQATETRVITLDAGTQLNRFAVSFDGLTQTTPVVTGIVLHDNGKNYIADAEAGYIAYADPVDPVNGQIFLGAAFPVSPKSAAPIFFGKKEAAERDAFGHIAAISDYVPGSEYVYYTGAGWSKYGFENQEAWIDYMSNAAACLRAPMNVTIVK